MNAADLAKLQKSRSEFSQSESTFIEMRNPKTADVVVEASAQNVRNLENPGEIQLQMSKVANCTRRRNLASFCFAFVLLWALMTAAFFLGVSRGEKEISVVKEEIKSGFAQLQVQLQRAINSSIITTTQATLSEPRFYADEQYKGAWFSPPPNWEEKKCIEMPPHMDEKVSSVKLGGHCLLICSTKNCEVSPYSWPEKCIEIHPGFFGLDNFAQMHFNDRVRSFRPCKKN